MAPKLLTYLARTELINQYGTRYPAAEILNGQQIILLYFASTHDEKPDLLEHLRNVYEAAQSHNIRLEVLHVPTDMTDTEAKACFATHGNWYSLLFGTDAISELLVIYNVIGTPTVTVIRRDGSIISREGDADLRKYGRNALAAWI